MKKFTKVMLILAGVLATVGLICVIVAFGMGLTTEHFVKLIQDGHFSFDEGDLHISFEDDWKDELGSDILSTEEVDGETSAGEIKESVSSMDIEFAAGILDIRYDDVEYIQVTQKNIPKLKVRVKNGTLVIRDETDIHVDLDDVEDRSLTILIPQEMQFEDVELEIGASKADIKDLLADKLSITVGAGQADISKITAKKLELEVGAGQATAVQLEIEKLDVEAGIGQVNIALNGVQEDYNYNVECGIGNVVVGKASYGGLGAEQNVKNDGASKEINVECGIGEVRIKFQE
ncbi:MAG: DUF4097 family beta strand repeat protein [Agathobacter sp.]|nr:DUF4097 family beta strand repeat protein [Agathobacter sp.]